MVAQITVVGDLSDECMAEEVLGEGRLVIERSHKRCRDPSPPRRRAGQRSCATSSTSSLSPSDDERAQCRRRSLGAAA